jgi:hypothetical protein
MGPGRPDQRRHRAPERRLDQGGLSGALVRQLASDSQAGVPLARTMSLCGAE